MLRRRCLWIFSFIIVIIFYCFYFLDIVSVKAEAGNFATAQCFPPGTIAGATAAERAASFLLSSESQLPATTQVET